MRIFCGCMMIQSYWLCFPNNMYIYCTWVVFGFKFNFLYERKNQCCYFSSTRSSASMTNIEELMELFFFFDKVKSQWDVSISKFVVTLGEYGIIECLTRLVVLSFHANENCANRWLVSLTNNVPTFIRAKNIHFIASDNCFSSSQQRHWKILPRIRVVAALLVFDAHVYIKTVRYKYG